MGTSRVVAVEVFEPAPSERAAEAIALLRASVADTGDPRLVKLVRRKRNAPWPHLKVMVADGFVAYIGSANITAAGVAGRNLELGVLVRAPQVEVIDRVLDLCRA